MAKSRKKITLLGFMGCGKSTVGRALSKNLKLRYVDLDNAIEIKEKASISEIFDSKGEEVFRTIETSTLTKALLLDSIIISLGGGTPCFNNNMMTVNQQSTSIYLHLSPETLSQRLFGERKHRPLIEKFDDRHNLREFINDKLTERERFYQKAEHIINGQQTVEKIVEEITYLLDS